MKTVVLFGLLLLSTSRAAMAGAQIDNSSIYLLTDGKALHPPLMAKAPQPMTDVPLLKMKQTATDSAFTSAFTAAAGLAGIQVAAGALVPVAMSACGTVVPGVGTIHAAGGVAATLQHISMVPLLATPVGAAVVASVAGAGVLYTHGMPSVPSYGEIFVATQSVYSRVPSVEDYRWAATSAITRISSFSWH